MLTELRNVPNNSKVTLVNIFVDNFYQENVFRPQLINSLWHE